MADKKDKDDKINVRKLRHTKEAEVDRPAGIKGGAAVFQDVETPRPSKSKNIWAEATGVDEFDPFSLEDTRGKVVSPALDRRLTPDNRARAVMIEQGVSYEEAVGMVVQAMKLGHEIPGEEED